MCCWEPGNLARGRGVAAVVPSRSPLDKIHPHPSAARCPATPRVSENHLEGRRWLSVGWVNASSGGQPEAMAPHQPSRGTLVAADRAMLQLSRSAAAARVCPSCTAGQGQGAYLFSQPACSLGSLCGHWHHGDRGTRPPAGTRAPNTGPGALTAVPALV